MEFPFEISNILVGRISLIEKVSNSILKIYNLVTEHEENKNWVYTVTPNIPWDIKLRKKKEDLETLIDRLGTASAQAQGLHSAVTTLKSLLNSDNQKIYVIRDLNEVRSVIGMLKVGSKRLFVCDENGVQQQVDPLCVMDFYIHESMHRQGLGREIFDAMLKAENIDPIKLAVDRPSPKCLAFFEKHYGLKNAILQNNSFVIYPGFLQNTLDHQNRNQKAKDSVNENGVVTGTCIPDISKLNSQISPSFACTQKADNEEQSSRFGTKWGVNEAMHSYSTETSKKWNNPSYCALSAGSVEQQRKRWKGLQSSWNILGVKPIDYSLFR